MIYQMASLPRPASSAALIGQQSPLLGPQQFFGQSVSKRQESLHVSRFRSRWRTKVKLSLYDGLDKHSRTQPNLLRGYTKIAKPGGATSYASIPFLCGAIPRSYIYHGTGGRSLIFITAPNSPGGLKHRTKQLPVRIFGKDLDIFFLFVFFDRYHTTVTRKQHGAKDRCLLPMD